MKPWEKYADNTQNKKPWEKYGGSTPAQADEYLNAPSPEIGLLDRMAVKTLGNSDDASIKYLQKQNPNLEFTTKDGEIYAKTKGDNKFMRLDPNQLASDYKGGELDRLKELGKDTLDLAYDIPAGALQGAATALGGIGGFMAGGGVGALPAAAAAGAASGGGLEYMRQKLGQALGINEDVKGGQVGFATGAGAVSPLLFGAGTSQALAKKVASGLDSEALVNASKGVIPRLWEKARYATSSVPMDAIEGYKKFKSEMEKVQEGGGIINYLENMSRDITNKVKSDKSSIGKQLDDAIRNSGSKIDSSGSKKIFLDKIKALESKPEITVEDRKEINALKGVYNRFFGLDEAKLPSDESILANPEMQKLYAHLDTLANNSSAAPSVAKPANLTSNIVENTASAPGLTYQPDQDSFLSSINKYVNDGIDQNVSNLDSEAGKLANLFNQKQEELSRATNQQQVNTLLGQIKELRSKLIESGKQTHISDSMEAGRAFDLQKKLKTPAAWDEEIKTSNASVLGTARDSSMLLNDEFAKATSGVSTKLKGDYMKALDLSEAVDKYADGGQKLYNTLSTMNGMSKKEFKERIAAQLKEKGIDVDKAYKVTQAMNYFENPRMMPVSSGGTTSTSYSTLGGGLGDLMAAGASKVDPNYATIKAASGLGNFLGNYGASPASMKAFIDKNRAQQGLMNYINYAQPTILDLLNSREQNSSPRK
jgi:hypothetical protein